MDTIFRIEWIESAAAAMGSVIAVMLPIELWGFRQRRELTRQRVKEMLASASPVIPSLLVGGAVTAFVVAVFSFAAELAPWHIPVTWWSALLALVAVDFSYYWDHRTAHENRTYWAMAHSVHHSSPVFDQTTALRVSVMDGLFTPWFYLPVILIGFDPLLVGACFVAVVGYQQWIHTEMIGRLPWLDSWLNTPSNHRVHHGVQAQYQDRNYGAVLMIWDRMFGTYAAEGEPVRYGITDPINSCNPVTVHFHEARKLWRDLVAAKSARDRLAILWHAPDWRPTPALG